MAKPFTAEEIAAITARYPTEGASKLAAEMGRCNQNIVQKARRLGLRCCVLGPKPQPEKLPVVDAAEMDIWFNSLKAEVARRQAQREAVRHGLRGHRHE